MKNRHYFLFLFLSALFFLSGACGLIYEIIWVRKLGLIFGNTTLAISTVLAVFMAGLGLGSYFFGKKIDSVVQSDRDIVSLRWYAALEIGIGVFCLFTPILWAVAQNFYVWAYQAFHLNFWQLSVLRFFICFAILFVPTFLMGGTLPVLTKFLVRDSRQTGNSVGFLYGINTLGAVTGVLFTGFFAIYCFGLHGTVVLTSGLNILIGLIVIFFLRARDLVFSKQVIGEQETTLPTENQNREAYDEGRFSEPKLLVLLLVAFAASGFASMVYELCWTRVLALCLGSSTYSFTIMLASFLTGIALGSLLIARLLKRFSINYTTFAWVQIFIAFLAIWGVNLFDQMPIYFLELFSRVGNDYLQFHSARFFLASIIILPPTIFIGCTLAIVTQILNRSAATTGKAVGGAYLINTAGCILGSIAGGFIFIPWLGIYRTLISVMAVNFLIGVFLLFVSKRRFSLLQGISAGFFILAVSILFIQTRPWSQGLLTTNIAIDPNTYLGHSKYEVINSAMRPTLLYYKEGLGATVAVKRNQDAMTLSINANIDASSGIDMHTQLMLGHLPTLFTQDPKRVLVIGMGSGVTLGALSTYPYDELHCVELEEAVVEAAQYFSKENRNVLSDPRLKNFINDGRNHLLAENFTYDVIVSEPSSLWMAGVANLFTLEQFKLMKKRLAPGGVVCQWINTYSMSPQNIQMIVKTFRKVFAHTSLWQAIGVDLLLIGSDQEIVYDLAAINKKISENPSLQKDLESVEIYDAAGLLSSFVLNDDELAQLSLSAVVNSDNFPYLEYFAPLNLYGFEKIISKNAQTIGFFRKARYPAMINGPESAKEKIAFHNAIARAFIRMRNLDEAGVEIGLSNREEPFNNGAALNYGIVEAMVGNTDEAEKNLMNYLKSDPASAQANFYLGKTRVIMQEFDLALKYYQAAAEKEPENYEYLFSYAEALLASERAQEAVDVLKKAIRIKGLNLQNGIFLSKAFFANKQLGEAVDVLEEVLRNYPYFFDPYDVMASFYEKEKQYEKGLFVCQRAQKKLPHIARNYYLMSMFYEKMGLEKEAQRMARIYYFYQNAPKIGTALMDH